MTTEYVSPSNPNTKLQQLQQAPLTGLPRPSGQYCTDIGCDNTGCNNFLSELQPDQNSGSFNENKEQE